MHLLTGIYAALYKCARMHNRTIGASCQQNARTNLVGTPILSTIHFYLFSVIKFYLAAKTKNRKVLKHRQIQL